MSAEDEALFVSDSSVPMSDAAASEKMKGYMTGDKESDHGDADSLLLDLLVSLGYSKTVEAFIAIPKWYA